MRTFPMTVRTGVMALAALCGALVAQPALAQLASEQPDAQREPGDVRTADGLIRIPTNTLKNKRGVPYGPGGGASSDASFSGGTPSVGAATSANSTVTDAGWFIQENAGPGWLETTYEDGRLSMIDTRTGRVIIAPSRHPIYDGGRLLSGYAQPVVEVHNVEHGCDIVFTFHNTTNRPQALGRMRTDVITLDELVTTQDFHYTGAPTQRDWSRDRTILFKNYPANWYSPAWVLRDDSYAVGVSLLYPMLDYEHDVLFSLSPSDTNLDEAPEPVRGWRVQIALGNDGRESEWARVFYENALQPGETRTYTMAIRVTDTPDDWMRTLIPYRNYFRSLYGSVKYNRNPDPIRGITMAAANKVSRLNPYGWANENRRPDQDEGWQSWIDDAVGGAGWPSVMLWKPGGQYGVPNGVREPSLFALQWLKDPKLVGVFHPETGLPAIPAGGKELGLWWGHAASRVPRGRPAHELEGLRAHNPDDVGLLLAEVMMATRAGATTIGLDSWHHFYTPTWDLYWMLRMMQEEYPQVRFCIEPRGCDVLHTLAPVFMRGWLEGSTPDSMDDLHTLKTPHYLADFLLPGHETWGAYRYLPLRTFFGREPTPAMIHEDARRYAELGYTPLIITPASVDLLTVPRAARTWEQTVPEDLRFTAGPTSEDYTYRELPAWVAAMIPQAHVGCDECLRDAMMKGGIITAERASSTGALPTTDASGVGR